MNLKEEISVMPSGVNARDIFLANGYKKAFLESSVLARAIATSELIVNYEKVIYENDMIVGSIKGLFKEGVSPFQIQFSQILVDNFGRNNFYTNADHYSPNYSKIVQVGINGLLNEIENSYVAYQENKEKIEYLEAMKMTMLAFKKSIQQYQEKAKNKEMIACLENLINDKPRTFRDALQLVWLIHITFSIEGRNAMALGRMDQYLYDFYKNDIKDGVLTKETTLTMLVNVFAKIGESRVLFHYDDTVNICVAGIDKDGEDAVNDLSYLILEAVKIANIPGPNLSARISKKNPDKFLDEALKVIGTGIGYPALMNDEINMAALSNMDYELEDVREYTFVGCVENFITGKQPPWSDSRCNTALAFEYVLNHGKGLFKEMEGVDTGNIEKIDDMNEFLKKIEIQLEYLLKETFARFNNDNVRFDRKYLTQSFLSCFCDDCIEKASDINLGGAKYASVHGICIMGIGTIADSMAAIEELVFHQKKATLLDFRNAIKFNYVGYEWLKNEILNVPKYGNNIDLVDKYAVWFVEKAYEITKKFKTRDGGSVYIAMASNISNIPAGEEVAATPDGRLQGEPLSDAGSPTYGVDVRGMTETVNSVAKPNYKLVACGTVLNQKLSPIMFKNDEKRKKLLALIRTYFEKGGQEMQINATSREVLVEAMENPEKYQNLIVRVSGFSAYFVTLSKEVQNDILMRTQQR